VIKVTVITLGRLKESYLRDASAEYQKRLSRYCSLDIVELTPEQLPDNASPAQIETALSKEAERSKNEYENKLSESEARATAYLKLADASKQQAEAAESRIAVLTSELESKESEVMDLKEKIHMYEKQISELNATVACFAAREEIEKREQVKYIKFRRPSFFRFIKK
jgi:23S rRNA pseudoU1915 N3-methylase RlmH